MHLKKFLIIAFLFYLVAFNLTAENKKWQFDLEVGSVWPGYNDVQIPRSTGTRFSLVNDFSLSSKFIYRIVLGYQPAKRHEVRLLLAPLSLQASGEVRAGFHLNETTFLESGNAQATYRFNSWRLTYRYLLLNKPGWQLKIGFTAKIRDAEISLKTLKEKASKTNIGFVPLLNLSFYWKAFSNGGLLIEGDALAAPGGQGRAEDFFAGFKFNLSPTIFVRGGYRIVEGGADVEEVYNFALLHYAVIALGINF